MLEEHKTSTIERLLNKRLFTVNTVTTTRVSKLEEKQVVEEAEAPHSSSIVQFTESSSSKEGSLLPQNLLSNTNKTQKKKLALFPPYTRTQHDSRSSTAYWSRCRRRNLLLCIRECSWQRPRWDLCDPQDLGPCIRAHHPSWGLVHLRFDRCRSVDRTDQ
mmetsp:Transcript_16976/g.41146  ORF Transcript_16976/g.41146 Transcript_16976/m.41146 type:complete len:160 (+) Transcript_16976:2122-2601(+)